MDKLLNLDQVSELLGVSSYFLKKRVNDGSLKTVKLGGNRLCRFRECDVERFVESRIGAKFTTERSRKVE